MRKITLVPEELEVVSFDVTPGAAALRGTVWGRDATAPDALCSGDPHGCQSPLCIPSEVDPTCQPPTCPASCESCASCGGTCDYTCENTCRHTCKDTCQDTCPPWIGTIDAGGAIRGL